MPNLNIGAVLCILAFDKYRTVAYESQVISKSEQNYLIHDKKLFPTIHALKKWQCYLAEINSL